MNLSELKELVQEFTSLVTELRQLHSEDTNPNKLGVWTALIGLLFGANRVPPTNV